MPPVKSKQRLSMSPTASNSLSTNPTMDHIRTPERSPITKRVRITQRQKQALVDNLQLEVTKRARKLRAQYALQAQSLRTRIERRVHRIPASLLKANIGVLLLKYIEEQDLQKKGREPPAALKVSSKTTAVNKGPVVEVIKAPNPSAPNQLARTRGVKRTSADLDKENDAPPSLSQPHTITTLKKRAKPNPHTATTTVLSPKSPNSRTLPASPLKDGQKTLTTVSRPQSPLKPAASPTKPTTSSPAKAAALAATSSLASLVTDKFKSKATRAAATNTTAAVTRKPSVRQLKKDEVEATKPAEPKTTTRQKGAKVASAVAAALRTVSGASNASNTSNATTVVTKKGAAKTTTAAKRVPSTTTTTTAVTTKTATTKKAPAAAKKAAPKVEAPAQGRRVLRKRG